MSQPRLSWSYALLVPAFAVLSLGSSSKSGAPSDKTTTTAASGAAGSDPTSAKLIGSCDRSDTFNLDCTEAYEPSINGDDKSECDTLGGKFRIGPCPRINAISQCFEGNAPYLSGHYDYVGKKTTTSASDCPRGYKDWSKSPALTANTQPASCNAVTSGGTCFQYSAVTADFEKSCIDDGGSIKQPPEPCPTTNGLDAVKLSTPTGTAQTEYFYTNAHKGATGSNQTWTHEDVNLICGIVSGAGGNCTHVPFSEGAAPVSAPSTPAKAVAAAKAKKKP